MRKQNFFGKNLGNKKATYMILQPNGLELSSGKSCNMGLIHTRFNGYSKSQQELILW